MNQTIDPFAEFLLKVPFQTIEIQQSDGSWKKCGEFQKVKVGDWFRYVDQNGKQVFMGQLRKK